MSPARTLARRHEGAEGGGVPPSRVGLTHLGPTARVGVLVMASYSFYCWVETMSKAPWEERVDLA